jgi:hypothetical protein
MNEKFISNSSAQVWKHLIIVITIVMGISIVYSKVSGAYYCAYDDFNERHRAAFEDTREPQRVFTTSHFDSSSYRPLNRGMTLLTYRIGHDDPAVFRVRNLGFHLLNIVLIYRLGWSLFRSIRVSGLGACLFGLHPLVNQSVNGAVWTNTMAHTGFLLALVMFIASVRTKRLQELWLAGGLMSGWLALLAYDSEIVVFGLMLAYIALPFLIHRERLVRRRFLIVFITLCGALLGAYFLLRALFVSQGWGQAATETPSPGIVVKNLGMYTFVLLLPIDSVLANEWLHTPLPSEIEINISTVIAVGVVVLVVLVSLALVIRLWTKSNSIVIPKKDWTAIAFLLCGIGSPLLPALLFRSHSSETYLYLPVAFFALLLSYGLDRLFPGSLTPKGHAFYATITLAFLLFFCAATWVRNQRVVQCGETAQRVLSSLPDASLMDEVQTVYFANVPGEPATRRYGLYGFRGVDTIGHGYWADYTIKSALQLVYQNESLTGEIVEPEELIAKCQSTTSLSHHLCLWVHWDGRVEALSP